MENISSIHYLLILTVRRNLNVLCIIEELPSNVAFIPYVYLRVPSDRKQSDKGFLRSTKFIFSLNS